MPNIQRSINSLLGTAAAAAQLYQHSPQYNAAQIKKEEEGQVARAEELQQRLKNIAPKEGQASIGASLLAADTAEELHSLSKKIAKRDPTEENLARYSQAAVGAAGVPVMRAAARQAALKQAVSTGMGNLYQQQSQMAVERMQQNGQAQIVARDRVTAHLDSRRVKDGK